MRNHLLAAAMLFAVTATNAQTDSSLRKAFLCQQEGGQLILVKEDELPNVRDALCRAIEYKHASDTRIRRCKLHKEGSTYTDQHLFRVEAGCTIIKSPLD